VPVGGGSDCDWSGGREVGCWATALPDSTANPTAAMADNLKVFIALLPYLEELSCAMPCVARDCTFGLRD